MRCDWMFVRSPAPWVILIFGSFFIHSSLSSSVLPEGKAALARSRTPGDLSGMNPPLGKFVAESFNSAELSLMRFNREIVAVSPPALSCYREQTHSSHKKRHIRLLFIRRGSRTACHHHLFAAAVTVLPFTLTYKQCMCNEPEDDSPACRIAALTPYSL